MRVVALLVEVERQSFITARGKPSGKISDGRCFANPAFFISDCNYFQAAFSFFGLPPFLPFSALAFRLALVRAAFATVIAESPAEISSLSVGEAVMRMDLADQQLLMFRNSTTGDLNVVYRRNDGHIGWIDPTAAAK